MAHPERLTGKQIAAIALLLKGNRLADVAAAAEVGVGRRTIYRWLEDPLFVRELRRMEGAMLAAVEAGLISGGEDMRLALRDVADNPTQPGAGNKRLAAQGYLETMLRVADKVGIEIRIKALEDRIYAKSRGQG